jgi:threonine synthase
MALYELRCRECGKTWGNQPRSICDDCFSPLEVSYDYDALRASVTRERVASRAPNMWRYAELLPLPQDYEPNLPVGLTPLFRAPRLARHFGATNLFIKNDAVCLPTLSFKDRVVAVALSQARNFGFDTIACSSTGNLANAVAAQAARNGLKAWIFVPADLEPAKILGTQVFGAKLVRIAGSYDQVNRLCSQIADEHRWGFVNVNLRPYYAEGSKTVGFEIAEQLGWRLPDNVVVPMAGGSLITKIKKAFDELIKLGLVDPKPVKIFGAQATGCSPISTAVKISNVEIEPQKTAAIAGDRESCGWALCGQSDSRKWWLGGGRQRFRDRRIDSGVGRKRRCIYRDGRRRNGWLRTQTVSAGSHSARRNDGALHHGQRIENH